MFPEKIHSVAMDSKMGARAAAHFKVKGAVVIGSSIRTTKTLTEITMKVVATVMLAEATTTTINNKKKECTMITAAKGLMMIILRGIKSTIITTTINFNSSQNISSSNNSHINKKTSTNTTNPIFKINMQILKILMLSMTNHHTQKLMALSAQ